MLNRPPSLRWVWLVLVAATAGALWWHANKRETATSPTALPATARTATPAKGEVAARIQIPVAPTAFPLFSFVQPDNAAALNAELPAPSHEVHYVRVDATLTEGKQSPFWQRAGVGRVSVPLPDGTVAVVQ